MQQSITHVHTLPSTHARTRTHTCACTCIHYHDNSKTCTTKTQHACESMFASTRVMEKDARAQNHQRHRRRCLPSFTRTQCPSIGALNKQQAQEHTKHNKQHLGPTRAPPGEAPWPPDSPACVCSRDTSAPVSSWPQSRDTSVPTSSRPLSPADACATRACWP